MFIAIKTEDGKNKGKIAFYCKVLGVTRQGFYHYLKTKDLPWKYQALADAMIDIERIVFIAHGAVEIMHFCIK